MSHCNGVYMNTSQFNTPFIFIVYPVATALPPQLVRVRVSGSRRLRNCVFMRTHTRTHVHTSVQVRSLKWKIPFTFTCKKFRKLFSLKCGNYVRAFQTSVTAAAIPTAGSPFTFALHVATSLSSFFVIFNSFLYFFYFLFFFLHFLYLIWFAPVDWIFFRFSWLQIWIRVFLVKAKYSHKMSWKVESEIWLKFDKVICSERLEGRDDEVRVAWNLHGNMTSSRLLTEGFQARDWVKECGVLEKLSGNACWALKKIGTELGCILMVGGSL